MRILLVNPPVPESYYNREFYPPLSLLYLGAALDRNGDDSRILDMRTMPPREGKSYQDYFGGALLDVVRSYEPDLIGINCLFSGQFPDVLILVALLKAGFPTVPIVVGGIHPTLYPEKILRNCPQIDWIVLGEGERSLCDLVNTLKARKFNFASIDGFAYREGNEVRIQPQSSFIEDLDSLPFPAYHKLNLSDYYVDTTGWHNPRKLPIRTSLPVLTSRSCPHRCSFCSMFLVMGPKWRSRSPTKVVDEIEFLYRKYDHHHFSFMDDNLTFKREHILEICRQIKARGLDIQFETPNGVATATIDDEVMDAMVAAGLTRVSFAIESGSDFIREKVMRKHLPRETIFRAVRAARRHPSLYVKAFFIIGMPEETRETLEETFAMMEQLNVDRVYLQNAVPFPGTRLFDQAVRDGLLIDIDPDVMYKADAFYITNYDRYFIRPYKLDVEELKAFRIRCERSFNTGHTRTQAQEARAQSGAT